MRLFTRKTIYVPSVWGCLLILTVFMAPLTWWVIDGERFLSPQAPAPGGVLVVEGWIGREGIRAAGEELLKGRYQTIVTTGSFSSDGWGLHRYSFAELATQQLRRSGVPEDRIITVSVERSERHRTYHAAQAVRERLASSNIRVDALTVFTLGPHGRRSRLVFEKVFGRNLHVGAVSWTPPHAQNQRWWSSSRRAQEFLVESAGWAYEWLLDSGRGT